MQDRGRLLNQPSARVHKCWLCGCVGPYSHLLPWLCGPLLNPGPLLTCWSTAASDAPWLLDPDGSVGVRGSGCALHASARLPGKGVGRESRKQRGRTPSLPGMRHALRKERKNFDPLNLNPTPPASPRCPLLAHPKPIIATDLSTPDTQGQAPLFKQQTGPSPGAAD